MDDFNSETDSDYTSYWRDWVSLDISLSLCAARACSGRNPTRFLRGRNRAEGDGSGSGGLADLADFEDDIDTTSNGSPSCAALKPYGGIHLPQLRIAYTAVY
jgi:hypothetical protein